MGRESRMERAGTARHGRSPKRMRAAASKSKAEVEEVGGAENADLFLRTSATADPSLGGLDVPRSLSAFDIGRSALSVRRFPTSAL